MHFSIAILAAVAGFASAANIQVVTVSSANNSLTYSPDNIQAAVGDMVQFQFVAGNHTVTQSTFDQPCQPISLFSTNVTGFHSGYMPVSAAAANAGTGGGGTIPTYTVQINSTAPVWVYCSQAKHCENGMVMVINENTAANASRSLAQFKALAASATTIVPGSAAAASNTTASTASSTTTTAGIIVATGLTAGASMAQVGGYLGLAGLLAAVFII